MSVLIIPTPVSNAALDAMTALHRLGFSHGWSRESFAGLRDKKGVICWGWYEPTEEYEREASKLQGFLLVQHVLDEAEILTFTVSPNMQNKGIGRALLMAALEWAQKQGLKRFFLEVAADNDPARRLYDRLGFVPTGQRAGYYSGVDAILMEYKLG